MKHNKYPQNETQTTDGRPRPTMADLNRLENDFIPSPDEVARKAYFTFVNQGSANGNDVQHWLTAEAELIAERNLTRVHGFHNRT
jgi:hypothetical protein